MKQFLKFVALLVFLLMASCGGNPSPQKAVTPSPVRDTQTNSNETGSASSLEESALPSQTLDTTQDQPSSQPTPVTTTTENYLNGVSMPLFGVETHRPEKDSVLSLLTDSGAKIVRHNGVLWHKVEPQEGQYNWAELQNLDIALQELAARDIDVILIVRGTPSWAQKVQGSACGPIVREKFTAFADFMVELVHRYSVPPYKVKYWELGNEPDVAPELVSPDHIFGCWGDSQDAFYGGGYYADMLKTVYPAIKSADPEAQVLNGGLLLDCDPDSPPEGKDCLPSRFFDGILSNGGADFIDIVSFHGYPNYTNQSLSMEWENPNWATRGGLVFGKIDYLRDVLQRHGVDKPIFLTESSFNCPEYNTSECVPPDEHFFEIQADYLVRLFVRTWASEVGSTIWYDFEGRGWRNGGLVGADPGNPKPAFQAFQYLIEKLSGMSYVGEAPLPEGVDGYIFAGSDKQSWVVWSQDESPQMIDLPVDILAVYNKYGEQISVEGPQIEVTSPVYFDVAP